MRSRSTARRRCVFAHAPSTWERARKSESSAPASGSWSFCSSVGAQHAITVSHTFAHRAHVTLTLRTRDKALHPLSENARYGAHSRSSVLAGTCRAFASALEG